MSLTYIQQHLLIATAKTRPEQLWLTLKIPTDDARPISIDSPPIQSITELFSSLFVVL